MTPNRLAREGSLYLRQHAMNPVDWYPWGDEALERARREDRPVFLSVGYASCHWCHVMEREVFEDPEAARVLNEEFVAIKVDREERPDLDAVYMEALQAMTGSGGWPMSLFLAPSMEPFYAATYLPRGQFVAVARRLSALYRERGDELRRLASEVATRAAVVAEQPPSAPATLDDAARLVVQARRSFDPTHGGMAGRLKFPTVPRWRALLEIAARVGDGEALDQVRATLDAMASGGLRDHLAGGFHRYATDPAWIVPHFEKMLYDQALLALLYLEAAQALGEPRYDDVARGTLAFVVDELGAAGRGFAASLDADSGGHEGSFYTWTVDELQQVAGAEDGRALALLLGVSPPGHVDGRSVLTRRAEPARVARRLDRPVGDVAALFERWRPALLAERSRRVAPARDPKRITSWNGLAVQALARGGARLGEGRFVEAAQQAAGFLLAAHRLPDGTLSVASNGGVAVGPGTLDDHAALGLGLVALHHATGEARWLDEAERLADEARGAFARAEGGFWTTREGLVVPLGRRFDVFDHAVPSGNGLMAELLHELSCSAARPDLALDLGRYLASQAALLKAAGLEMGASMAVVVRRDGPRCGPEGCAI